MYMAETETDCKEDDDKITGLYIIQSTLARPNHPALALGGLETQLTTVHNVLFCLWYFISLHADANALEKERKGHFITLEGAYVIFNLQ